MRGEKQLPPLKPPPWRIHLSEEFRPSFEGFVARRHLDLDHNKKKSKCVAHPAGGTMGAGVSSSGAVEIPESMRSLLSQFAGPATRTHSDPLWVSLLASCDETPLCSLDPAKLDQSLHPTATALCKHNRNTAHLSTFLLHAARLLRTVRAEQADVPTRAINAVVFATSLLKHHVEFADAEVWREVCSLPPSEGGSSSNALAVMRTFLEAVVHTLAKRDSPSKHMYALHVVCVKVLSVVCATALFCNPNDGSDSKAKSNHHGFDVLAKTCTETRVDWVPNRVSGNTMDAFVAGLLSRIAERRAAPKSKKKQSLVFVPASDNKRKETLASRFVSAFAGITGGSNSGISNKTEQPAPLADACARLVLVLVTFPMENKNETNPFRSAFQNCRDDAESSSATTNHSTSIKPYDAKQSDENPKNKANKTPPVSRKITVDHALLLKTLCAQMGTQSEQAATALVYFLYFDCVSFFGRTTSRLGFGDAGERLDVTTLAPGVVKALDKIGRPSTETLSSDTETSNPSVDHEHAFVFLPVLVRLSCDLSFVEAARRRVVGEMDLPGSANPSNSTNRSVLSEMFRSLTAVARRGGFPSGASGSSGASSAYCRSLALGAMANIAHRCVSIDPQTASKLVGTLDAFERKERSLMKSSAAMNAKSDGDEPPKKPSLQALAFGELIFLTLEVLNTAVTYSTPENPELVYALLHRRDMFEPRESDVAFDNGQDVSFDESNVKTRGLLRKNLQLMLTHLDAKIEPQIENVYVTAERVMEIAARASAAFDVADVDGAVAFKKTTFEYAEFQNAVRAFFAPHAWRLVVAQEWFVWDESRISAKDMLGTAVGERV